MQYECNAQACSTVTAYVLLLMLLSCAISATKLRRALTNETLFFIYLSQYCTKLMHKICLNNFLFHAFTCFEHMFSSSGGQNCTHSVWNHQTYMCDDTRGCVMQF